MVRHLCQLAADLAVLTAFAPQARATTFVDVTELQWTVPVRNSSGSSWRFCQAEAEGLS